MLQNRYIIDDITTAEYVVLSVTYEKASRKLTNFNGTQQKVLDSIQKIRGIVH